MKAIFWSIFLALVCYAFWSKYGDLVHDYFYPTPEVVGQPTPTPKPKPTTSATQIATPTCIPTATPVPTPNLIGRQVEIITKDGETTLSGVIKRQEPDGVVLVYADGIKKIPFRSMTTVDQEKYGYNSEQAARFIEIQRLDELERQKVAIELAQKKQQEAVLATTKHAKEVGDSGSKPNNPPSPPNNFIMQKQVTRQVRNSSGDRYMVHGETYTVSENVTVLRRDPDGLNVRYDYGNECKIQYYNLPEHVRRAYGFPMSR